LTMTASYPVPFDELQRLAKVAEYGLLNVSSDNSFDNLAELATQLFNTPIAFISVIGGERQSILAMVGLDDCKIAREISLCPHTILEKDILVIRDAMQDPAFHHNPYVVGAPYIRFYAGIALRAPSGEAIGSSCVIDPLPRHTFTATDRSNLISLADLIVEKFEVARMHTARRADRTLFETVAATAPDAILCADSGGRITFWNRAAEQLFGLDREAVRTCTLHDIIPELAGLLDVDGGPVAERTTVMTCRRHDGGEFSAEVGLLSWQEGDAHSFGAIVRDVTKRRAQEAPLFDLASMDALTGLPNRTAWHDRLSEVATTESGLTLLLMDLDGFKQVNDTLGHRAGDLVLAEVGNRLRRVCDMAVMVARLGGDKFVCLLRGDNPTEARALARKIIDAVSAPILQDGLMVEVGVSIGISLHPEHCSDPLTLMEVADLALYRAKMSGKCTYEMFISAMEVVALLRRAVEEELRFGFRRGEFELFYQPQISTTDRSLVGAEALLRWNHPTRGLLGPASFIEVLGKMPLSLALGDWILETACRDTAEWLRMRPDFRISVNLFPSQFRAGRLLPSIRKVLSDSGLPPSALEVEIVENILTTEDRAMLESLQDLRAMGVGLAFDDYGTGFASLSMLKRYPASRLKIDQSFVRDVDQDEESAAVVKVIIYLASVFGMETIAEGIETEEQFAYLASHGCPQVQGYLFGHPVPAKEFLARYIRREDEA